MSRLLSYQKKKVMKVIDNMDRPADIKRRLRTVVETTIEESWDDANTIVVGQGKTLWQAVLIVDPSFTRIGPRTSHSGKVLRGWPQVPSQILVALAILDVISMDTDDLKIMALYNQVMARALKKGL